MRRAPLRLLLIGTLLYLVLLAGLASRVGALVALAIPLMLYVAAAIVYGPEDVRLRVVRTAGVDRVYEDVPVDIELSVTNQGSNIERIVVQDLIPASLKLVEGETRLVTSLPPGESSVLRYKVFATRGLHEFGVVRVCASDHLNLFRRQVDLFQQTRLPSLPRAQRLRHMTIRPLRTRGTAGPIPSRQGGSGVDFYGVREYQAGDPRRWINWRVSARHPQHLFTNEFEQERIADVGLILDARLRTEIRLGGDSLFEHAVRATAALAHTFLADGNRVGLLVYGQILDWTFPGYGKIQRERVLQALARAEPGASQVFDDLEYLPTRFFPAKSQIVLVSPTCTDDLPALIRLRARGYQLLVIRPDPVAFEQARLPAERAVRLAARIVNLERALLLRKMQQAGIQVVDWQVDKPFDRAIHAHLGRVPHWFRVVGVGAGGRMP